MTIALISIYDVKEPTSSMYYHKLYNLLSERKTYQNISHKKMPTWEEHVKFLDSKPHKAWYVIYKDTDFVGSIYLSKENEIGIFLREVFAHQGIGKIALRTLLKKHKEDIYYANIAPFNSASLAFFTNMGFQMHKTLRDSNGCVIQWTLKFVSVDKKSEAAQPGAASSSESQQLD